MADTNDNQAPEPTVRDKALKGPRVAGGFKGDIKVLLGNRQVEPVAKDGE